MISSTPSGSNRTVNASDIQNLDTAAIGHKKIAWAQQQMPVLRQIQEQVSQELPLKGLRVGASLHITSETAHLAQVLKAAGAEVALCACNPLSTQDEVAAAPAEAFEQSDTHLVLQRDEEILGLDQAEFE